MWRGLLGVGVVWAASAGILRLLLLSPEVCPPVTSAEALASAQASSQWTVRQQNADGSYLYEYDLDVGQPVSGYNAVRHAGVTMALYQLAAGGEAPPNVLPAADRGMDWMRARLYRNGDWAALQADDGTVELGASALMLAGLEQRRFATGDASLDPLMHELGRFLLAMQQPDGSFLLLWDVANGAPDPALRSKYATGESFWVLTVMRRLFPAEDWERPSRLAADYLSLYRDEVEQQKFPPWADQWAAKGLAEMADWPLDEANITYARSLAERFGFLVRVESQRTDGTISKWFHGRRSRAAGMGTWSEGLDALWRVADTDPRMGDMKDAIGERAACAAGMLHDRQLTADQAAETRAPAIAEGAWFTEGDTRMDDQQHALVGLLEARQILDERAPD